MRLKRHIFKHHLFLGACVSVCCIIFILYSQYPWLDEKISFQFLESGTVESFLIDTPGCQIPAWDPWDSSVSSFIKTVYTPYKCPGQPSFLRALSSGLVSLDKALLQYYYEVEPNNVSCTFQEIYRGRNIFNESVDSIVSIEKPQKLIFDDQLGIDFIKTTCSFRDSPQSIEEFIPLTPLKASVEGRCVRLQADIKQKPMNIIFLGIDSVSNLNFMRHFPKCRKYLSDFLSPITLKGYNKVGDNTFPNIVPLLTGHFYQYYYDEVHNKSMFFDDVDFSWKEFAKLGYRTLLAEDAPSIATFNYNRNGFKIPPTDYYYRPFALALENSDLRKKSKSQCFGSKMEMQYIYDYLKNFVDTMGKNRPFFAFLFLARLTHDVLNYASYADEPTYQLLKYLNENDVLENTMLIFYSDHGIRYGSIRKTRIGQYEERMPFMHFILPRWFLDKHPKFHKNLNTNRERLTTPFDIHATVLHLANLMKGESQPVAKLKPGISLFREIPRNRTCSHAGITPHWCTCQRTRGVSINDVNVKKAAQTVIETVNSWTNIYRSKCAVLMLDLILDARIADDGKTSASNFSDYEENWSESLSVNYLIIITSSPSEAIFEATVRCERSGKGPCKVIDDISRINEYGMQSICISHTVLKKFCYCV